MITVAKGLTSGYFPLSGVIVGDKVWEVLEQGCDKFGPIGHGWTYSAHALGMAAGIANLDIIEKEKTGRELDLRSVTTFQQRLHQTFDDHPLVGEVRGVALLAALEFVAGKSKKERFEPSLKIGPRIAAACLDNGLIARAMPHGDILGFAPPLITTTNDIDIIVDLSYKAVERVARELIS